MRFPALPITDRGYETHKSSRVPREIVDASRCLETSSRENVWIKSKTGGLRRVQPSRFSSYIFLFFFLLYFYDIGRVNVVEWNIFARWGILFS